MSLYSIDEQFVIALKKRNFKEAERLLNVGDIENNKTTKANINKRNIRGETPVFFFSNSLSLDILEWLINHGADVNIANDMGDTPLFASVQHNELDVVDTLLNGGADVDKPNSRKVYPLMQSVLDEKDHGVLERLLEANPNVDPISESQTTPLLAAAARGKKKYVELLLDHGAAPQKTNYLGQGLLHAAILSHDASVLKLVSEKVPYLDPDYASRSGTTAMSSTLGMPEMTEILLDMGGDPNAKVMNKIHEGVTLLMASASSLNCSLPIKGQEEQMKNNSGESLMDKLIKKGADVSARTDGGANVGFFVINSASFDYFSTLIANGLDPKRPLDINSTLPYDFLAQPSLDRDNPELLNTIEEMYNLGFPLSRPVWDKKIDGEITEDHKRQLNGLLETTVLSQFVSSDFWPAVEKCLILGANINEELHKGEILSHLLVEKDFNGLSDKEKQAISIAQKAKNINKETQQEQLDELLAKADKKFNYVCDLFNKYQLDWNKQNDIGDTPLHLAAKQNNMKWSKFLLCNVNVDPSLKNKEGLTPAGVALKHGNVELFYLLSEVSDKSGYDTKSSVLIDTVLSSDDNFMDRLPWLNAVSALDWSSKQKTFKNKEGQDALYLASATDQHDTVRVLLKMGFNPNVQDNQGNTPLMQAVFNENAEIIRLLRAGGAKLDIKNKSGATVENVANYIKSTHIHKALESNDLEELCQDLMVKPLNKEEKQQKRKFKSELKKLLNEWLPKNEKESKNNKKPRL